MIKRKFIEEINKGKLLGITFDNKITMSEHIKHTCKHVRTHKTYVSRQVTNSMHLLGSLTI